MVTRDMVENVAAEMDEAPRMSDISVMDAKDLIGAGGKLRICLWQTNGNTVWLRIGREDALVALDKCGRPRRLWVSVKTRTVYMMTE